MRMPMRLLLASLLAAHTASHTALADAPTPLQSLARMPVKEVTVFKDGHAFVLHSGTMPVDAAGCVVLDSLPCPVIGTFWPFSADKKATLSSVTASSHKVLVERTALDLRELIEANLGAEVRVTEVSAAAYRATLVDLPAQRGEEQEALDPANSGEKLTHKGTVVLLKTAEGLKVVGLDRIQDISFLGEPKRKLAQEEFRNLLTMKLDWEGGQPQTQADVGLLYLQRGIRWIPSYRVNLDGKGKATVKLQATLINELADLTDVDAHLVVGVPTFAFKETPDPMSLQQAVAQLSSSFRENNQTAYGFSNAIMSQQMMPPANARRVEAAGTTMDLGPGIAETGKNEDLFVFTVKRLSLRKGQRMVVTLGEFPVSYRDVYSLELPLAPPPEVWRHIDGGRQTELARLFNSPKVFHKIRLSNTTAQPFTTAPALLLRDDRILAQGMMTYAAPGAEADLEVTSTLDILVKKSDNETGRTPNAANWQGDAYGRIDLAGLITLTSLRKGPVEVEVVRQVLGNVDTAGADGKVERVNLFEDASLGGAYPTWWGWFPWPWWWSHFNGVGRIAWTVQLEPGKPLELPYTWHYFWR